MIKIHPMSMTIIIGTLFSRLATFMAIPFLIIYLTHSKGISPAVAGGIIGISSIVGLFGGFIGGFLSDRYGRKVIMITSIIMWGFVFIGFALANSVGEFFLLNALNGLCRSFFEPSSRALMSDITPKEQKLMVFNLRYAAINVGAAIGPLIGFILGAATSTSVFWITAIVYFIYGVALLIAFKLFSTEGLEENQERVTIVDTVKVLYADKFLMVAIIGMIFGVAGYSQFSSTIPQYLSSSSLFVDGKKLFTIIIIVNAITVLLVQYPVSRIGKYTTPLTSIMLGTLTTCIGLGMFGMSAHIWWLIVAMIIFTIGEVMMFTMTDLFVDGIANPQMKGAYFGAMGFTSIGNAIGPWVGGTLFMEFGAHDGEKLFLVLSLFSMIGFFCLLGLQKYIKKQQPLNYKNVM